MMNDTVFSKTLKTSFIVHNAIFCEFVLK